MFRKVPIVACPISAEDLQAGLAKFSERKLNALMREYTGTNYVYFTGSGTSALYLVLKAVSEMEERKEVIIPAYTASSIIHALQKAGLKPVLGDISLDDFNMSMDAAVRRLNKQTLAVIGVHMFGIINRGLPQFKGSFPGVFTLEDCCQSFGSRTSGKNVGNLGEISFFSFNRGKNLPLFGGGMIATNNIKLAGSIGKLKSLITPYRYSEKLRVVVKLAALSLVVNPSLYGILTPLLQRFKEQAPPGDFALRSFIGFQAGVALSLLGRIEEYSRCRYNNAMSVIKSLEGREDIRPPFIDPVTQPAFNRLPLLFKDLKQRDTVARSLQRSGIETSRMYYQPLHKLHNLEEKPGRLKNAEYLAEHLLCVPVHPLMQENDIAVIIDRLKNS